MDLHILNTLSRIINPVQIGLYHHDGIIYISNRDGPRSSSIQKKMIRTFKILRFKIDISSDIKIANFLDVTQNLSDNSYKPFLKTDQYPSYINVNSNHPNHPNAIIKQFPKAVNMRIRKLSSIMNIFHDNSKSYIEAFESSGVREEFTYQEPKIPNENNLYMNKENTKCNDKEINRKNRKRKNYMVQPNFL